MHYDPIKQSLGHIFNRWLLTRRLFYRLLDLLLLRTWHIHKEIKRFARKHPPDKSINVLDAGSGFGQYTHYMARKNKTWNITAIDLKEDEINACRSFFEKSGISHVHFQTEDLTRFTNKEAYDLILSVDVMEHIEDDRSVFTNFFESLKPGGLLLVNTPSDKGGSGVSHGADVSFIDEHVRDGYSPQEMKEKLTEAGFMLVEAKYTYGWPGSLSWHLSMKYPIQMLGLSKLMLLVLPVYYLFVMPFALILNMADVRMQHQTGTGLIVKAWKQPKH